MLVFLGPKDVAARLGISERGAQRLMKAGEIPSFRAGFKPLRTTELHLESYAVRRTLEERGALPPGDHSKSSSGLPQSQIRVISGPSGLVIGRKRPIPGERRTA